VEYTDSLDKLVPSARLQARTGRGTGSNQVELTSQIRFRGDKRGVGAGGDVDGDGVTGVICSRSTLGLDLG